MDRQLYLALEEYKRQRDSLLTAFPELADDEQALLDTTEGVTDLQPLLAAMVRAAREDEAMSEALKAMLADMNERKQRLLQRAKKRLDAVAQVMDAAGIKKLLQPDFTASVKVSPPVAEIVDESLLPDALCRIVTTRHPDKAIITEKLRNHDPVPGAVLGNGSRSLTIRNK